MKEYKLYKLIGVLAGLVSMIGTASASDFYSAKASALLQQQVSLSEQAATADFIENTLLDSGVSDLLMGELGSLSQKPNSAQNVQDGSFNRSEVSQEGGANVAKSVQMGNDNSISISQDGVGNYAAVKQYGSMNSVDLTQVGNFNHADITQHNQNNHVDLTQRGIGMKTVIEQSGNQSITIERVQSGF